MQASAHTLWALRPDVTFLNHGSFGACPRSVLAAQAALRDELEGEPVAFFLRAYPRLLGEARAALAALLGCAGEDLVFVTNATEGCNTVIASWPLEPGDEVLTLDHAYPACRNALDVAAARAGARVVAAPLALPASDADAIVAGVLDAVGPRTRYALIDWITSPSAVVLPVAEIVSGLRARGVETLVDAAHAPGMVAIDLDGLGAAWTTGNLHKWLCAPKGAAFLHLRRDVQRRADGSLATAPLVVSHGHSAPAGPTPRLHQTFDWCGTFDPTAIFAVGAAIAAVSETDPSWAARMARNRDLALAMCERLVEALPCAAVASPALTGAMAAVRLSADADAALRAAIPPSADAAAGPVAIDPLQDWLWHRHRIEVPIIPHVDRDGPYRMLRVSAQAYNDLGDVERVVEAVRAALDGAA